MRKLHTKENLMIRENKLVVYQHTYYLEKMCF